jgi:hypothetical protein
MHVSNDHDGSITGILLDVPSRNATTPLRESDEKYFYAGDITASPLC